MLLCSISKVLDRNWFRHTFYYFRFLRCFKRIKVAISIYASDYLKKSNLSFDSFLLVLSAFSFYCCCRRIRFIKNFEEIKVLPIEMN